MQADVVVIGGGGAGLAAAVSAASAGARVVLLEKNSTLGGTTVHSIGSLSASQVFAQNQSGVVDSPDEHYKDIEQLSKSYPSGPNNDVLRRLLVDNVSDTVNWLSAMGVEFFGPMEAPGHSKPRTFNAVPNADAFIYHLERRAKKLGVKILYDSCAQRLLIQHQQITGVEFDSFDGKTVVHALRGVVLASGDYAGNAEMKRTFLTAVIAATEAVNPMNTGDGHRMALALGAQIVNADLAMAGMRFLAPASPSMISRLPPVRWLMRPVTSHLNREPESVLRRFILAFFKTASVPENELFTEGAVLINKNGGRFADETKPARTHGKMIDELSSQPEGQGYIMFDARLAEKFSRWPHYVSTAPGIAYAYLQDFEKNRPDLFHSAQTPEELATKLSISPAALKKTIEGYNSPEGRGGSDTVVPRGERPPLLRAPYYALGPVKNYINFTDGGLAISARFEVLDANGSPIPRLFAVGATGQGGLPLKGHGNHISWIFTSGRLAGRYAAQLEPSSHVQ